MHTPSCALPLCGKARACRVPTRELIPRSEESGAQGDVEANAWLPTCALMQEQCHRDARRFLHVQQGVVRFAAASGRVPQLCGSFRRSKNPVTCPISIRFGGGIAMVSPLVYYQLALLAIIWLFVMLPLTGSKPGRTAPLGPAQPKRKRSTEPKAFEGLTHKPHCSLCERETAHPQAPPPMPPDPMPSTNRRPREVDTSMHFCPHLGCDYRGWLGMNNLRANGHPNGGPWRQFHCTACQGYFLETHGTLFHGKQAAVELIVHVLACLAEGLGIRATARVFEVEANTVLHWLVEAAEQLRALAAYFLCNIHLEQLQLDELYAVLRDLKAGAISEDETLERLERSPDWVWTAMDPKSKLLVVVDVGPRTLAMAQRVLHQLVQGLALGCVPLFVTDGFNEYRTAVLTHFGHW